MGGPGGVRDLAKCSAKVRRTLQGVPSLPSGWQLRLPAHASGSAVPTTEVAATVNQDGLAADARLTQTVSKDLDVVLGVKVTRERQSVMKQAGLLGASASAEAAYKVGGGRLVGAVETQVAGGTQLTATYRL